VNEEPRAAVTEPGAPAAPASASPPAPTPRWASAPRRRRLAVGALAAGAVVLALVVWAVVWYEQQVHAGPPGAQVVVEVAPGSSVGQIDAELVRRHVASSTLALRVYWFFHGTPLVSPGGYALRRRDPLAAVRAELLAGPDVLEVPAGFTVAETAARLSQLPGHDGAALLAAVVERAVVSPYEPAGAGNLDGLLGTGQYVVGRHEPATELLRTMVARFDRQAAAVGLDARAGALGITPYQAVIVASIVQKEGVYPQNLAKVARVVYNRLARGMPLQMDSTVLYAEHRDGGPVTSSDLSLDSPYNTYLHSGLTPTPICFPSVASLRAALEPAPGDWLYFVLVSPDGTEAFSDTLAGQEANEQLAKSRGLP
jgi:UPF0755 protein